MLLWFAEMNVSFIDRLTKNDRKKGNVKYRDLCGGKTGHWYNCSIKHCFRVPRKMSKLLYFLFLLLLSTEKRLIKVWDKEWIKIYIFHWEPVREEFKSKSGCHTSVCFYGEEGEKILKNVVRCKVIVRRWLEDQYVFEMHIKNQMYVLVHFYCFSSYLICTSFHSISSAKKGLFKNLIALRSVTQNVTFKHFYTVKK